VQFFELNPTAPGDRGLIEYTISTNARHRLLSAGWFSGFKRSPRGDRVVAVSHRTVYVKTALGAEPILEWKPHTGWIMDADWSPDGKRILTAGEDQTAALWDAETGRELLRLRGHGAAIRSAEFSPDGQTILTSGDDGKVILWKVE